MTVLSGNSTKTGSGAPMATSLMASWFLVTTVRSTAGICATSAMDTDIVVLGARRVSYRRARRPRSRRRNVGTSCPRPDAEVAEVEAPDVEDMVVETMLNC